VVFIADRDELVSALRPLAEGGNLILFMGAGDITQTATLYASECSMSAGEGSPGDR
jgi:UDP-N-acetylmuramate-alanine ligase